MKTRKGHRSDQMLTGQIHPGVAPFPAKKQKLFTTDKKNVTLHTTKNLTRQVSKFSKRKKERKHKIATKSKAGVNMNLSDVLRIEERKLFLEHHQTVDIHARALQVASGLFWCPSTNF